MFSLKKNTSVFFQLLAVRRQRKSCRRFVESAARRGRQTTKHAVQIERVYRQLVSVSPMCLFSYGMKATRNSSSSSSSNDTPARPRSSRSMDKYTYTHLRTYSEYHSVKVKLKVKFSHTSYRALGPELIPVYRQSARR